MIKVPQLTELQLSALQEIGNIGSGHAAIALSQLLSRKIMVAVTRVKISDVDEFANIIGKDKLITGVYLRALGDVQGAILLVLEREGALRFSDVLMNYKMGATKILGEMEQSAIKEAGSILSASYLNAISDLMKLTIIPSVPRLIMDKVDIVFESVFDSVLKKSDVLIGIETEFIEASTRIKGYFLFMPDKSGLQVLLKALGV